MVHCGCPHYGHDHDCDMEPVCTGCGEVVRAPAAHVCPLILVGRQLLTDHDDGGPVR